MQTLSPAAAEALVVRALVASGSSPENAASTAAALVAAEIDGQAGHGLARVASYAAQVKVGKIDGRARPVVTRTRAGTVRIDAKHGFAYPALDAALESLPAVAAETGIAAAGIFASHHIGQAGRPVERLAERGLLALAVSNTPKAMAFAGGKRPMMGTNPLAFAAPLAGRPPLVIDLALSLVARSKIVAAQKAQRPIPAEWAVDGTGQPTSDATAALAGALAPIGGAKGAALALMVEILCAALAGGEFGWAASSFLDSEGAPPGVGQMLIVLDPAAFSAAAFPARMAELVAAVASEPEVRLPGERRLAHRERVKMHGLAIASELHAQLTDLARAGA